eukprot:370689_1
MSHPTKKYTSLVNIGKGSFGNVFKAKDPNGNLVAIKKISDDKKKSIERELILLSQCDSQYIIKLIDQHYHNGYWWIILEYCAGGSIACRVGKCTEIEIKKITFDVLNGLQYLHSQNLIHRDIKPSNILHSHTGIYKLADFGEGKQLVKNLPKTFDVGTPYFMAPEIIEFGDDNNYDQSVDIWSLGVTLYKLITDKFPFKIESHTLLNVMLAVREQKPLQLQVDEVKGFSHDICDIINNKCLVGQYDRRYTAEQLLKHRYFNIDDEKNDTNNQTTLIAYCNSIRSVVETTYPSAYNVWIEEPKGTIAYLKAKGIIEAQQLLKEFDMPFKQGVDNIEAWKEYKQAIYEYLTIINSDKRLKTARQVLSQEIWEIHYKRFPCWPKYPSNTTNQDVIELNKRDKYIYNNKWFIVWSVGGSITIIDHRPERRIYKAKFNGKPTLRVLKVDNHRLHEFDTLCNKNRPKAIETVTKYIKAPLTWDSL